MRWAAAVLLVLTLAPPPWSPPGGDTQHPPGWNPLLPDPTDTPPTTDPPGPPPPDVPPPAAPVPADPTFTG
jgi:hypothetical protein